MAASRVTTGKNNVASLPTKVHFSLLAEDEDPVEQFRFEAPDGTVIELSDPTDLTIDEMASLHNPLEFLRYTASEEDKIKLRNLKGKQMSKLIKAYFEHYGVPTEEGKGNASPF
jgi:hypothetical protein